MQQVAGSLDGKGLPQDGCIRLVVLTSKTHNQPRCVSSLEHGRSSCDGSMGVFFVMGAWEGVLVMGAWEDFL